MDRDVIHGRPAYPRWTNSARAASRIACRLRSEGPRPGRRARPSADLPSVVTSTRRAGSSRSVAPIIASFSWSILDGPVQNLLKLDSTVQLRGDSHGHVDRTPLPDTACRGRRAVLRAARHRPAHRAPRRPHGRRVVHAVGRAARRRPHRAHQSTHAVSTAAGRQPRPRRDARAARRGPRRAVGHVGRGPRHRLRFQRRSRQRTRAHPDAPRARDHGHRPRAAARRAPQRPRASAHRDRRHDRDLPGG